LAKSAGVSWRVHAPVIRPFCVVGKRPWKEEFDGQEITH